MHDESKKGQTLKLMWQDAKARQEFAWQAFTLCFNFFTKAMLIHNTSTVSVGRPVYVRTCMCQSPIDYVYKLTTAIVIWSCDIIALQYILA